MSLAQPALALADAQPVSADNLVECTCVVKTFGGITALKGVDFTLKPGEVHALLGQNGAGKSTLIKLLCGVMRRNGGAIRIMGSEVHFETTRAAQEFGVGVVHQELSLAPNLSVAANLLLTREPRSRLGFVDRAAMREQAAAIAGEFGLLVDPDTPVGSLTFAQRQLLEIAKAFSRRPKILILDEPTSALSANEEKQLFEAIHRLTERGVGVIYVTHRLKEVFRIAQRVTVLRDGRNVLTCDTHETDLPSLVTAISGQPGIAKSIGRQPVQAAPVRLTLDNVVARRVNGASLELRRGEIVGLAGIVGSGRTDILEAIYGVNPLASGRMSIDGKPFQPRSPSEAIARGIALVPEDRHLQGLVLNHSIERNVSAPRLNGLQRLGFVRGDQQDARSKAIIKRLSIKANGPDDLVRNLSGGNQQKVVFGKWLQPDSGILMLDEPTVGVDVGARPEMYAQVNRIADDGAAVLVVASELEELLLLCSRIGIVHNGRIVRWMLRSDLASEDDLHRLVQVHS